MSPLPDHAPRRSRRSPITPLADHANHAPPHPLPCHGNCFLLLKHPAQLHAQRKMYQGQVISGLCGLLQVAWACKFIGLKVTSCWERSSSALPAVPKKLICSAFRWLNSLMRGRLSWLLLAAALQGSASTRSPECRELDVVVGSIDYMSMRLCSVQVSVPVMMTQRVLTA